MVFVGGGGFGGNFSGGGCWLAGGFVCHDRANYSKINLGVLYRMFRSM